MFPTWKAITAPTITILVDLMHVVVQRTLAKIRTITQVQDFKHTTYHIKKMKVTRNLKVFLILYATHLSSETPPTPKSKSQGPKKIKIKLKLKIKIKIKIIRQTRTKCRPNKNQNQIQNKPAITGKKSIDSTPK